MTARSKPSKDASFSDPSQEEKLANEDTPTAEEENHVFQEWYKAWVERNDNSKK